MKSPPKSLSTKIQAYFQAFNCILRNLLVCKHTYMHMYIASRYFSEKTIRQKTFPGPTKCFRFHGHPKLVTCDTSHNMFKVQVDLHCIIMRMQFIVVSHSVITSYVVAAGSLQGFYKVCHTCSRS